MSTLILPEIVHTNRQLEAQLERLESLRERGGWLRHFDDQLKALDPNLSLVKAREGVVDRDMKAGCWHVRRENGGGLPDSYLPITDENGGFVEPHMGVLDGLRSNDLQRAGRMDELRREWDRIDAERERRRAVAREERLDELALRYKAAANPGVLFSDNAWTWRAGARKA